MKDYTTTLLMHERFSLLVTKLNHIYIVNVFISVFLESGLLLLDNYCKLLCRVTFNGNFAVSYRKKKVIYNASKNVGIFGTVLPIANM